MSQLRERLKTEFADPEYREVYAEDFLNTNLATQIQVIREQREMTQAQLAEKIGTKQTGISRIENVNYSAWNITTLKKVAFALGCRLKVTLETFGSLLNEAVAFNEKELKRPSFEEDPAFRSPMSEKGQFEETVATSDAARLAFAANLNPSEVQTITRGLNAAMAQGLSTAMAEAGSTMAQLIGAASTKDLLRGMGNQRPDPLSLLKENSPTTFGMGIGSPQFVPSNLDQPIPAHAEKFPVAEVGALPVNDINQNRQIARQVNA